MNPLLYNGKEMSYHPLNISIGMAAQLLARGDTVMVQLEPGDATYYALLIVPCWTPGVVFNLGRYGVPPDSAESYLLVTKVDSEVSKTCFIRAPYEELMEFDTENLSNNRWSRTFLAWWLTILWEAIHAQRTPRAPTGSIPPSEQATTLG